MPITYNDNALSEKNQAPRMMESKVRKHKVHVDFLRLFAIFFMISGALLLPKEESLGDLFRRRIARFLAVLVLFWGVYVLADAIICSEYTLVELLRILKYTYALTTANTLVFTSGAMWFLYCYIAFLFLLPFLRVFARTCGNRLFLYIIALQVVTCAILPLGHLAVFGSWVQPELSWYLPFCGPWHHPFGGGYCLFYALLGYYVENRMTLSKRHFGALCLGAAVMLVMGAIVLVILGNRSCTAASTPVVSFIAIPLVAFYYGAKRFFESVHIGARARGVLSRLGGAVFATMVLEGLLAGLLSRYLLPGMAGFTYWGSLGVVCIIWAAGLLIGCVCKRIPGLKSIL